MQEVLDSDGGVSRGINRKHWVGGEPKISDELRSAMEEYVKRETPVTELVCPSCGNSDPREFIYWEYQAVERHVDRVDENGKVIVGGYYEGSEIIKDPSFRCDKCGLKFGVGGIKHDFE